MTLLIVDDSANIRNALKKTLALVSEIKNIYEASDIAKGIELIDKYSPDIMVLDIMLKSGTGLDLLKAIKSNKIKPKTILYSNFLDEEYIKSAKKLGVVEYFDKSDDIMKLLELVKKHVV